MLGRTDSRLRMLVILLAFSVFATAAGARLGYWQVVASDELTARATASSSKLRTEPMVRGDIVDRGGEMLARMASYDQLVAYPDRIHPDAVDGVAGTLGSILALTASQQSDLAVKLVQDGPNDRYAVLRSRLTAEESEAVKAAAGEGLLPGIGLEPRPSRVYPRRTDRGTTLASQLIGYVRGDNRGGAGVERYYHERLTTPAPGSLDLASIGGLPMGIESTQPPELQLTVDFRLQRQLEREIHNARTVNEAKSVSAIVMDPHTGAILAAATVPSYDANQFAALAARPDTMSLLKTPFVSELYEPGSVMKTFTIAAALDKGKITPQTRIRDASVLRASGARIRNADKGTKGSISVKDVMAYSRNVATARIAKRLAPGDHRRAGRVLYDMWETVGMTGPTGIDVSGEAAGLWRDPAGWAEVDLANASFGQGVSVTLIHLARGYSTLVNGGYLVRPHVSAEAESARVEKRRVLKPTVAQQVRGILRYVVRSRSHIAAAALIPGYEVGGKTGTGQIWDPRKWNRKTQRNGAWKQRRYNHSFVGFVGGRDQEAVIAVRIEEPKPIYVRQGDIPLRIESYQLFGSIAKATVKYLEIKRLKGGKPDRGQGDTTDAASSTPPIDDGQGAASTDAPSSERIGKGKQGKAGRDTGDDRAAASASRPGARSPSRDPS